jgi:hypothetical protein
MVLQLHHQHQELLAIQQQQQLRRRCRSIHLSSRCLAVLLLVGSRLCLASGCTRLRSSSCLALLVLHPLVQLSAAAAALSSMRSLKGRMSELALLAQQPLLELAACLVAV